MCECKLTQYHSPIKKTDFTEQVLKKNKNKIKKIKHRPSLAALESCSLILNIPIYGAVQFCSIFSGVIYSSKWKTFSFNCLYCFILLQSYLDKPELCITFSWSNYKVSKNVSKNTFFKKSRIRWRRSRGMDEGFKTLFIHNVLEMFCERA